MADGIASAPPQPLMLERARRSDTSEPFSAPPPCTTRMQSAPSPCSQCRISQNAPQASGRHNPSIAASVPISAERRARHIPRGLPDDQRQGKGAANPPRFTKPLTLRANHGAHRCAHRRNISLQATRTGQPQLHAPLSSVVKRSRQQVMLRDPASVLLIAFGRHGPPTAEKAAEMGPGSSPFRQQSGQRQRTAAASIKSIARALRRMVRRLSPAVAHHRGRVSAGGGCVLCHARRLRQGPAARDRNMR